MATEEGATTWYFDPRPLRTVREQLGLSPSAFGGQVRPRMTGAQILDIEKRRRGVTVRLLLRLCNQFRIEPGQLFRERGGTP